MIDQPHSRMQRGTRNDANLRRDAPLRETRITRDDIRTVSDFTKEVVYCFRYNAHIKIGYSKNFPERLKEWRRESHRNNNPFTIVAAMHGTKNDEGKTHNYFKSYNLPGQKELFYHEPELTDWIRWLRSEYYVQVEEEYEDGIIRSVPKVDPRGWLPSSERRIAHEPNLFIDHTQYGRREITADDYYTPSEVIALVKRAFGGEIDLDPASHAAANTKIAAKRFYTEADNGRSKPWYGRVWLNPPFHQWPDFADTLVREWRRGEIGSLLVLASNGVITARYFQCVMKMANIMFIPDGRFKFWGQHASSSTSGHVILGFARAETDLDRMRQAFGGWGIWEQHEP